MVRLEKFTASDFNCFISWVKTEDFMHQFAGPIFTFPITNSQLEKYLAESNRLVYKVLDSSTNDVIGHAEINRIDKTNNNARFCRILIADEKSRGKGIGVLLINELLKIAFDELNLHRVDLGVFDFNTSAVRCYEKCGFKIEGLLKEAFVYAGKYHSVYNMAILKKEWLAL